MKTKLIHPLWTHIPAIAALVAFIIYVAIGGPIPAKVPVHFGLNGLPNRYGSPWLVYGITIGLSLLFILLSVLLDEIWAKQERVKTFNWFSLLDEIAVGAMVGTGFGYLIFIKAGASTFGFPWVYVLLVCGGSIILDIFVETIRPFRLHPEQIATEDTTALESEVIKRLRDKMSLVYWDYQNPLYVTTLTTVLPVIMFVAAALTWFSQPLLGPILLIVVGILLVVPYSGLRTIVTRQVVTVRFGVLGIRVLRLKIADIVGVESLEFSPLKDFGGYGIRVNREMKAYILTGHHGVKITTIKGKKYLIGSNHSDRLAAFIRAIVMNHDIL